MTLNLAQLKKIEPTLEILSNYNLPIEISFRFSELIKKINVELSLFEEVRKNLILKYGENIDGTYTVTEDNMPNFIEEIESILKETVELDFEPINRNHLPKDICLTPMQLIHLGNLII